MRHGQAISNTKAMCSCWPEKIHNPLTKIGKQVIKESVKKLLDKKIDLIFASPLLRTQQTAEIVGRALKIKIRTDKRLREIGFGKYNNKNLEGMWKQFKHESERVSRGAEGGESSAQILNRMMDFLKDVNKKYKGKNILIVSHEGPLFLLQGRVEGLTIKETITSYPLNKRIHKGEIRELN